MQELDWKTLQAEMKDQQVWLADIEKRLSCSCDKKEAKLMIGYFVVPPIS